MYYGKEEARCYCIKHLKLHIVSYIFTFYLPYKSHIWLFLILSLLVVYLYHGNKIFDHTLFQLSIKKDLGEAPTTFNYLQLPFLIILIIIILIIIILIIIILIIIILIIIILIIIIIIIMIIISSSSM